MARKKKRQHEDHIDESWLIPYSDLLTLLLALFIVLFAMSSIDAEKFKQMAAAFRSEFNGGTGVMDYPAPIPQNSSQSLNKEDSENKETGESSEKTELAELQKKMDEYIAEKDLQFDLTTTLTDEGLMLVILNDILFDSGSAELRAEHKQLAKEVSGLLVMNPPRNIIISGHTDNIPISNGRYDTNWHLSVMRAVNFMKVIMENPDLDARWYSAKGYGEYKPVDTNETEAGRRKNRRVEILVLPNQTGSSEVSNEEMQITE